ncbi:hypothetical protein [Halococcus thailandensis]|uniref:Uncharacterized protein n=1 Tax=Halococcus thailandensis JCM 13552 TaxID=1227457 RepID=M0NGL5_9EURY|nr:hypothetical protein [Halococcus thailandensis]EMA56698.1 hypothetical protein C451_00900 [Halococcus thailandensis JCM 13552]
MSWRYYEKSTPKEVEDGIEAQSKRGDIGEQWWSRRFVDVVEPTFDTPTESTKCF